MIAGLHVCYLILSFLHSLFSPSLLTVEFSAKQRRASTRLSALAPVPDILSAVDLCDVTQSGVGR